MSTRKRIRIYLAADVGEATEFPPQSEFLALVTRANRGGKRARAELCEVLDRHPVLWQQIGDLCSLVRRNLIRQATTGSVLMEESVRRYLDEQRRLLTTDA